jgi:Glycine zipper
MITKVRLLKCAVLPALLACGCSGMNNADRGTVGGGLLGAGAGAAIGSAAHAPGIGALIGAGTGALIGGAVGDAKDRKEQAAVAQAQAQRAPRLEDIAYMAQSHISDGVIINQIRTTGAVYNLTATDIGWLKSQGVSDEVVSEMQATAVRYPRRVYVVDPPPPPVAVGVGVGFTSRSRGW